jgi:hypothetical protein
MRFETISIHGHYEQQQQEVAEQLQVLAPESDLETDLVAWSILPHRETMEADSARRDYVFHYELEGPLTDGLYQLRIEARDASGRLWSVEIAAALVVSAGAAEAGRTFSFIPFWFISKHLHFRTSEREVAEHYPGPSFGHLRFTGPEVLPHRRLFGAGV